MRLTALFLFLASATAFVPLQNVRNPTQRLLADVPAPGELCDNVVGKTETVLGKIDDLILNRGMRLVNHIPALFTLKQLGAAAGGSVRFGIDAAASSWPGVAAPALLSVPTWTNNMWRIICAAQLVSIAKSVLASDGDELSQGDIAGLTAANFVATKAATSANPLGWVAATAIVSGYSGRHDDGDGSITIHNAALQLMSSFTSIATILGVTNALPGLVPFLDGKANLLAGVGLAGYYAIATRGNNNTTKKVVNAAVIGGILWNRISSGALALTRSNLLAFTTLVTAATAYVAYGTIIKAKDALA